MSTLAYCQVCGKHTRHTRQLRCLECEERKQLEFDKKWYAKSLEDKIDWLYEKVKKIDRPKPDTFG